MKIKKIAFVFFIGVMLTLSSCTTEKYRVKQKTDSNGYSYETVTNDPFKARIYTLDNGLKVYLSVNEDQPRIQTLIAVKAGSTYDPPETTGLAHYLEHMMFKGTSKIGSSNWEAEKILLEQISNLYEQHKAINDPTTKKNIYSKIDSLSLIAAQYAIPSEYDKIVSSIGAKGTNAGTWYESTVYENDIPSNELEKWLKIESTRFSELVLRLFHTELETVYEEFNMRQQDSDMMKMYFELLKNLFPNHPYGTQTVIGKAEHLKNPSMVNIHNYWNTYYVPNNMAFCLSGDINFEETIQLIDKYWGNFEKKEVTKVNHPKENPLENIITKELHGPEQESILLGYRFNGTNSEDEKFVTLIDIILSNSKAGLIDLNLVQAQKILMGGSNPEFMKDYGFHYFFGIPREGQKLEEVQKLLLGEIEKIKNGEIDDWLIEAVINDLRLNKIQEQENNSSVSESFADAFTQSVNWIDKVKFLDELEKITKEELITFAKNYYKDNYVVIIKRTGEKDKVIKIDSPEISEIPMNRDSQSEFCKNILSEESTNLQPVFVDFEKEIQSENISSAVEFSYLENETNELFQLIYIIDMGKNHIAKLPIAVNYLPYLGTSKYSPSELQQELFKYGLTTGVQTGNERSYIFISGIEKSAEKGIELLEHILADVNPDQEAYNNYIDGIIKKRSDTKLDKQAILFQGLFNYAKYGKFSPTTNILSEKELRSIKPEELTDLLKEFTSYKHKVFYYGQKKYPQARDFVTKMHIIPEQPKDYPIPVNYPELDINSNKVYYADYDMVQANIVLLTKDQLFNLEMLPKINLFNEYYGGNMSSIVFQEIREAKALAYSAFATYSIPEKPNKSHYLFGYVGTQSDKLKAATDAMLNLMNDMPESQKAFDLCKESILKKIETERITKTNIFWTYQKNMDRGINHDYRNDIYEFTQHAKIEDVTNFFDNHVKNKKYNFLVIGKKDFVDMNTLKSLGEVKELTLEELFNY